LQLFGVIHRRAFLCFSISADRRKDVYMLETIASQRDLGTLVKQEEHRNEDKSEFASAEPGAPQKDSSTATSIPFIPQPHSVAETGISPDILAELALKEVYYSARPTALDICNALKLPFTVVDEVLGFLKSMKLCEIVGSQGRGEQLYEYGMTEKGNQAIQEFLARNLYRGPAPVTLEAYREVVKKHSINNHSVTPDSLRQGLASLVLGEGVLELLGPALNSGESIFLYGASGNGKTSIAAAIRNILNTPVLIPYAIEVAGQFIKVYDPSLHEEYTEATDDEGILRRDNPTVLKYVPNTGVYAGPERRRDRRWVLIKRPVIIAGGDLTLDRLELRYDHDRKFHQAPMQMKANGGCFVIDDFGRQQVRPIDLLNRWIIPLDRHIDYLTLVTGETIDIPFDLLLVFSSNLDPSELVDEAFLRRVRHKVCVPDPTREQFRDIFWRVCYEKEIQCPEECLEYLLEEHYHNGSRPLRACHPIDILKHVLNICNYEGVPPVVTKQLLDRACLSYFGQAMPKAIAKASL